MVTTHRLITIAAFLLTGSSLSFGQSKSPANTSSSTTTMSGGSTAPYTEGSVWQITMVRTKAGMTDDYLKGLSKTLKTTIEEEKKQGLVLSYKIMLGEAATPGDYNVINMVEFKNMAALDNLREKTDPIFMKIVGGEQQLREGAMKRAELREIVGTKLMREITLK